MVMVWIFELISEKFNIVKTYTSGHYTKKWIPEVSIVTDLKFLLFSLFEGKCVRFFIKFLFSLIGRLKQKFIEQTILFVGHRNLSLRYYYGNHRPYHLLLQNILITENCVLVLLDNSLSTF
jgi:hypothetical protein